MYSRNLTYTAAAISAYSYTAAVQHLQKSSTVAAMHAEQL
jgi:hypothetical protein